MSEIARVLREFTDTYGVSDLAPFFIHYVRTVLLPVGIICLSAAGALKVFHGFFRMVVPKPLPKRYDEIKSMYRKGHREQALHEWKQAQPTYPPAILSRACHDIYVLHRPKSGMDLLQELLLLKSKEATDYLKEVQNMKADALAIHNGNSRMVDMNARIAKQEYLGIATM
jgi:hypothetical protein